MTRQQLASTLEAHELSAELAWALLDDEEDWSEEDLEELFAGAGDEDDC